MCEEGIAFVVGIVLGFVGLGLLLGLTWNERVQAFFSRNPAVRAALRRERRIDLRAAELIEMGLGPEAANKMAKDEVRKEYDEMQQVLQA